MQLFAQQAASGLSDMGPRAGDPARGHPADHVRGVAGSGCSRSPIAKLLPRLESGDTALTIGADAAAIACLLAAHDVEVVFTASDMTLVDQVESRVAEEALGHYCTTYVSPTGDFPPELPAQVNIIVIDTATLGHETSTRRREVLERLMQRTVAGGVHILVPSEHALAPEAYLSHYAEWTREDAPEKRRPARSLGLMLGKPPEPPPVRTSLENRPITA